MGGNKTLHNGGGGNKTRSLVSNISFFFFHKWVPHEFFHIAIIFFWPQNWCDPPAPTQRLKTADLVAQEPKSVGVRYNNQKKISY